MIKELALNPLIFNQIHLFILRKVLKHKNHKFHRYKRNKKLKIMQDNQLVFLKIPLI